MVSFLVLSFPRCTRTHRHPARPKGADRGELCDRVANSRRKAQALSLVAWFDVRQLGSFVLPFPPLSSHQQHPRATDGADRREALTANFSVSLAKCGVLNTARKICQIARRAILLISGCRCNFLYRKARSLSHGSMSKNVRAHYNNEENFQLSLQSPIPRPLPRPRSRGHPLAIPRGGIQTAALVFVH